MKKVLFITFFSIIFGLFITSTVSAHPGNTDYLGCHTCSTNCSSWGLYYGEYHCHTPKYTTPTCPIFSTYSSLSGSCECNYGYVSSGGQCISENQYCQNRYGFNSRYNSLSDTCECSYGYVIDTYGKCSSGNSVCWNKYGYNSRYNSLNDTCECSYGYVFNKSGNKCISEDESCKESYGYGAKATISGDKCECRIGYEWEGNKCVLEITYTEPVYVPTKVNTPSPTLHKNTNIISPTSSPTSSVFPSPTLDNTTDAKIEHGILFEILNIIKKFFGF